MLVKDDQKIGRNSYQANLLCDLLTNNEVESICDVGCGKGLTANILTKKISHKELFLFDIGAEQYRASWNVNIPNGQILNSIKHSSLKFDLVYSMFVAEHVMDLDEYFSDCISLLNLKGIFIACLPDLEQNLGDVFVADHPRHMTHQNLLQFLSNSLDSNLTFKTWKDPVLRALFFVVGTAKTLEKLPIMPNRMQNWRLKLI